MAAAHGLAQPSGRALAPGNVTRARPRALASSTAHLLGTWRRATPAHRWVDWGCDGSGDGDGDGRRVRRTAHLILGSERAGRGADRCLAVDNGYSLDDDEDDAVLRVVVCS